jgi:hypothetical protein
VYLADDGASGRIGDEKLGRHFLVAVGGVRPRRVQAALQPRRAVLVTRHHGGIRGALLAVIAAVVEQRLLLSEHVGEVGRGDGAVLAERSERGAGAGVGVGWEVLARDGSGAGQSRVLEVLEGSRE